MWDRVAKDGRWEHPKAPAVSKLWEGTATEAVLEFLRDTRVGCWQRVLADGEREGARGGGGRRIGGKERRPRAALAFCVAATCTGNCTGFLFLCLAGR